MGFASYMNEENNNSKLNEDKNAKFNFISKEEALFLTENVIYGCFEANLGLENTKEFFNFSQI